MTVSFALSWLLLCFNFWIHFPCQILVSIFKSQTILLWSYCFKYLNVYGAFVCFVFLHTLLCLSIGQNLWQRSRETQKTFFVYVIQKSSCMSCLTVCISLRLFVLSSFYDTLSYCCMTISWKWMAIIGGKVIRPLLDLNVSTSMSFCGKIFIAEWIISKWF